MAQPSDRTSPSINESVYTVVWWSCILTTIKDSLELCPEWYAQGPNSTPEAFEVALHTLRHLVLHTLMGFCSAHLEASGSARPEALSSAHLEASGSAHP